jgi:hypothetical protein
MDFTSILTTLWNKISKPTPNVLIGYAFLKFAPKEINWFGYVFLAIGISSLIEWILIYLKQKQKDYYLNKEMEEVLLSLNEGEKNILAKMIQNNEQTVSINYNDYHSYMGDGSLGGRSHYVELFGICSGLQSKGVFHVITLTEITSFSIFPAVWSTIKKISKKNPALFKRT